MTNELKPAVPSFASDAEAAYTELGKTFVYVKQLSNELLERAKEMNDLDDARIAAIEQCNEAERKLGAANNRISDLETALKRSGYLELDGWIVKEGSEEE